MYFLLTYFSQKRIYVSRVFFYQTSIWICLLKYPTNECSFYPVISEKSILICLLNYPKHEATLVSKLIKRSRAKSDFSTYFRDPIELTTTSWILQLQLFWDLSATASAYFHFLMVVFFPGVLLDQLLLDVSIVKHLLVYFLETCRDLWSICWIN